MFASSTGNVQKMEGYSVKKLAALAGVSVRTLHLYDRLGLLKPRTRTETRYRLYGEQELLRLQQLLFYKELDFPLQQIGAILDDPDFDFLGALQSHEAALQARHGRIASLLVTVDKTILKLSSLGKEGFARLQAESKEIWSTLAALAGEDPAATAYRPG